MKHVILAALFLATIAWADTPPPNTVKAKLWSGDGNTQINATGNSIDVDVTNSSLAVTGTFWQTTQPVSGTFWQTTQPVSLVTLPSLAAGSNVIGGVTQSGNWSLRLQDGSGNSISSTTGSLNVDVTNTVPVSGTITATNSANGNTGSAVPTQATQIGGSDGTNLRAIKVSSTGVVSVDGSAVTQPVSGTFWQTTQPISGSVTANIGTTNGLALDTSVNGLLVAQGSTTSGQTGTLTQASVSTSAPSYTNAKTSPLSLTTAGALRTDASATTQPVSGTVTANAGTGSFTVAQGTGTNLHVVVDTAPTTAVTQSGSWATSAATPTALTVKAAAVTIGTSAVRLTNNGSAPASTRVLLVAQLLAASTANCFMGPSTVTSSGSTRGIQMFAGQSFSFNNDAGDYYAICDSSSQTFLITEQE